MFEKNNTTFTLNVLYEKELEMCPDYISKINSNCEKEINLLMIPNDVKTALLKGTTSKHDGNSYFMNCSQVFRTKNKLYSHEKVCEKNRVL